MKLKAGVCLCVFVKPPAF